MPSVEEILETPQVQPEFSFLPGEGTPLNAEFSRPSKAWTFNANNRIVEVPAGTPKHFYDPRTGRYEGVTTTGYQSENRIANSSDLSQWAPTAGSGTSYVKNATAYRSSDGTGFVSQGPNFSMASNPAFWFIAEADPSQSAKITLSLKRPTNSNQAAGVKYDWGSGTVSKKNRNTSDNAKVIGYRPLGEGPNGLDAVLVWAIFDASQMSDYSAGDNVRIRLSDVSGNPYIHHYQFEPEGGVTMPIVTGDGKQKVDPETLNFTHSEDVNSSEGTYLMTATIPWRAGAFSSYFELGGARGLRLSQGDGGARDGDQNAFFDNLQSKLKDKPFRYAISFDSETMIAAYNGSTSENSHNGNFSGSTGSLVGEDAFSLRSLQYYPRKFDRSTLETLTG